MTNHVLLAEAGQQNSKNTNYQLWRNDNHPIELYSEDVINQKVNYIHNNLVEQGFVQKAEEWLDSSCSAYFGAGKSNIELIYLE